MDLFHCDLTDVTFHSFKFDLFFSIQIQIQIKVRSLKIKRNEFK